MDASYTKKSVCAVTQHRVNEEAETNPDLFKHNGKINVLRVLCYLGFDIRTHLYNNNITIQNDALIRSTQFPRKCYRTKVYQGYVRMAANPEGGFHTNKYHHMLKEYETYGTLQAKNVLDYIKEEELLDINEFGGK